jgi:hypothetical protein
MQPVSASRVSVDLLEQKLDLQVWTASCSRYETNLWQALGAAKAVSDCQQ